MKISSVDCVTELLAYTYHLTDQLQVNQIECERVSDNYKQLIQRAKAQAAEAGIPQKKFDQALFAVFAWIDEMILETGWQQKHEWIKNSLQKKFFNTSNAGTQFFTELEKMGSEDKDVLAVYDYCLASGFKGSLYEPFHQEKLTAIRIDTRKKLTNNGDLEIPEILFPEAGDIIFNRRLKRKCWKGRSGFSSIFVLLPILFFSMLYYFLNERLFQLLNDIGFLLK